MEYMQMTLNDWLEMKQSLERELSNLKTGFIRVGYVLRKIDDSKGYEQDGYKSVAEFAKAEYGLSASTVSRFMAINEKFSLNGYSERLDPKYIGFRQSIMGEMLGLSDQDLNLVTPETSRQDVRELKQFNRQEPEKGIADDLRNLIETYFRENRDELNELYNSPGTPTQEILNPSGNKVYRKGMYMMFFYTDCVKTKKFGGATDAYNWGEFRELIDSVFSSSAGQDTYGNYFGIPQQAEAPETEEPKPAEVPQTKEPETGIPLSAVQEMSEDDVRTNEEAVEAMAILGEEHVEAVASMGTAEAREETDADVSRTDESIDHGATEGVDEVLRADPEGTEDQTIEDQEDSAHPEGDADGQGEVPEDEPSGAPEADAAEGAEQEKKPSEIIAPAQIMPEPEQTSLQDESDKADSDNENYSDAVADAGKKLEEIRRSYEDQNWMKMSEQLLSLGFIVNQLKVMQTMHT